MVKCSCEKPHVSPAEKPQQRLEVFSIQTEKRSIYAPSSKEGHLNVLTRPLLCERKSTEGVCGGGGLRTAEESEDAAFHARAACQISEAALDQIMA